MQISDLVGQYSRNVANGTEELHGAQSVQKLVSTIGDLSAGSIFEGTINSVRGGKVTLALGNGQTITARLDGKMDLQQGSSMFFQVRANDGQTIAIRPYTELGNVSNPILLNALSAAQVPATDRTLVMVDTMMHCGAEKIRTNADPSPELYWKFCRGIDGKREHTCRYRIW